MHADESFIVYKNNAYPEKDEGWQLHELFATNFTIQTKLPWPVCARAPYLHFVANRLQGGFSRTLHLYFNNRKRFS